MSLTRIIKLIVFTVLLPVSLYAEADKTFTVMIDPGHGGKDVGALGKRANEKTINLAVGKKLRDLINSEMSDATVVMTRDDDFFVTLKDRSTKANKSQADIFVSIHANSVDKKSPLRNTINGAAVYTLGLRRSDTNLSLAMRENEVMKLEPDYTTSYQGFDPSSAESYIAFEMMQHSNMDQSIELAEAVQNELVRTAGRKNNGVRQAPFWVLVGTTMPAILVELDFICNPAMEKYMASEAGQDKLALAIYRGIERFRKNSLKHSIAKSETTETVVTPVATSEVKQPENEAKKQEADKSVPEVAVVANGNAEKVVADKMVTADNVATDSAKDEIVYKIQFLTSATKLNDNDSRLKGLSPVSFYTEAGIHKYTFGEYSSKSEASAELKNVKKLFGDAFVIKTRNGKRIK